MPIYSYAELKGKIKVGDKVRAVSGKKNPCSQLADDGSNTQLITQVSESQFYINGCEHWWYSDDYLELLPSEITWETLKQGDELRHGNVSTQRYFIGGICGDIYLLKILCKDGTYTSKVYNFTLDELKRSFTIVQPTSEPEVVEMTVAEISKELGKNIKVVE